MYLCNGNKHVKRMSFGATACGPSPKNMIVHLRNRTIRTEYRYVQLISNNS